MSFVLQFTESGDSGANSPRWRGAIEEVESGERSHVTTSDALLTCLAGHGIELPPDAQTTTCPRCGKPLAEHGRAG